MKRLIILSTLLMMFIGVNPTGAVTYYVDVDSVTEAVPYSVDKAAVTIKTVVDYIATLNNGGGDTIYVAAGTYDGVNNSISLNDVDFTNLTIIGPSDRSAIMSPGSGGTARRCFYATAAIDGVHIKNMTLDGYGNKEIIYRKTAGATWSISDCDFVENIDDDGNPHISRMMRLAVGLTNITRCRFFHRYDSGNVDYVIQATGTGAINLTNSLIASPRSGGYTNPITLSSSGTSTISNCNISDVGSIGIGVSGGTVTVSNSFIMCGLAATSGRCIGVLETSVK